MFVRIENTKDNDVYLVVNELDRYLGRVDGFNFAECIVNNKTYVCENDFLWWYVEKECLDKYLR